jgi:hypothetical protein
MQIEFLSGRFGQYSHCVIASNQYEAKFRSNILFSSKTKALMAANIFPKKKTDGERINL